MQRRLFIQFLIAISLLSSACLASAQINRTGSPRNYIAGDVISPDIFVSDKKGSNISLSALLGGDNNSKLNVLFIFGGGDLGSGLPGHLWCQDSFEDTHILRTLMAKYQGQQDINFIAVASAPVYHTQALGFPARVFLDETEGSKAFEDAQQAFIASTMASFEDGILPLEPYFDSRFRLMMNRTPQMTPGEGYGDIAPWQGAFRSADETQFYGVPSFWVLSSSGEVLAQPMRGNIYYPHAAEVNVNYTFNDIDKLLQSLL